MKPETGTNSVLRCKMHVTKVAQVKNADGTTSCEEVDLRAVYGDSGENAKWSKWTPAASFTIQINNPNAFNKLSSGHEFFVDFTPAVMQECCGGKPQCCEH